MKKHKQTTIIIFFIAILSTFYCCTKKVEPFTLKNQKITLDVSGTDKWMEQLDSIDTLIYSKINFNQNSIIYH